MLFLSTPLVQPNRAPAPLWGVEGMEWALPLGYEEQFLSVLESFHTLALEMPIFGLCIVINQIFPRYCNGLVGPCHLVANEEHLAGQDKVSFQQTNFI